LRIEPLPFSSFRSIERLLNLGHSHSRIVGSQSTVHLGALCAHPALQHSARATLLIFATEEQEREFLQATNFFDPSLSVHSLVSFDVSPYSNLYPSRQKIGQRLNWLFHAQRAGPGQIFSATVEALAQKTLPQEVFVDHSLAYKIGSDIPDAFGRKLDDLGYSPSSTVESYGQYAVRGGIVDVFSPASTSPYRFELFGNTIDSIRLFDPETQRSSGNVSFADIAPAQETLLTEDGLADFMGRLNKDWSSREIQDRDKQEILHQLNRRSYFHGLEFLLPFAFSELSQPLDYFVDPINIIFLEPSEIKRVADEVLVHLTFECQQVADLAIRPPTDSLYLPFENFSYPAKSKYLHFDKVDIEDFSDRHQEFERLEARTTELLDFQAKIKSLAGQTGPFEEFLKLRLSDWRTSGEIIYLTCTTLSQAQRLEALAERLGFIGRIVDEDSYLWDTWCHEQRESPQIIHIVPRPLPHNIRFQDEKVLFLRDEDLYGRKAPAKKTARESFRDSLKALSFSDLKEGDFVVHKQHGVGIYGGLKVMSIQGVDAEFIQLDYKDKDRLYLPIYRIGQIQKYSGPQTPSHLDKLGGQGWLKTKTKVRSHLRDLAAELLKIYSARATIERDPYTEPDTDYQAFEAAFPHHETEDQLRAINAILADMTSTQPMDRLVCGDVGFGKTEVAMRAAFKAAQDGRQVAIIAPTTVLTFQHFENFKKRFKPWPLQIRSLNRFVPQKTVNETIQGLKSGDVDIVIGTHRLLSQDIQFKNLGLLIIDEEQKFGVKHKERLRKFKLNVDTLALSATPIPRTLNMSLVGIRDLSIINTPPQDRLPTRTFVTKFDGESIRRAVLNEVARGGQVFFIHNRIQSIYGLADELRSLLPDTRMSVAHGQMEEGELEKIMVSFFNHEIDLLLCTTIIESGVDVSRANTMFIDNAHQFGLSQLYQLRGRVGRSSERAYCYLLIPPDRKIDADAKERLKVLQENTALGSGITVAQYDLELRGSGDILGEEQSGNINAVGYELYLELLEEAVHDARGDTRLPEDVEPEINLRIPALIPDQYIPDIKLRLSLYKTLSDARDESDIEKIEENLRDQFGNPPESVMNLLGVMLIRLLCKKLFIRDLSAGPKTLSLSMTTDTPLSTNRLIELASRPNKKYTITPDQRLNVRMNEITWPKVYDELQYLLR
jgi:transcription-repair coupling factor (superfamily II helicase)